MSISRADCEDCACLSSCQTVSPPRVACTPFLHLSFLSFVCTHPMCRTCALVQRLCRPWLLLGRDCFSVGRAESAVQGPHHTDARYAGIPLVEHQPLDTTVRVALFSFPWCDNAVLCTCALQAITRAARSRRCTASTTSASASMATRMCGRRSPTSSTTSR